MPPPTTTMVSLVAIASVIDVLRSIDRDSYIMYIQIPIGEFTYRKFSVSERYAD